MMCMRGDGRVLMGPQPASAAGRAGGSTAIGQGKQGGSVTAAYPNESSLRSDVQRRSSNETAAVTPSSTPAPQTSKDPVFCDDAAAKKACEAEDRTTPGVKSASCFAALLPYAMRLTECDLATFLANDARALEILKKETPTEADSTELMGLVQKGVPASCKSALACFGSSLVGAKAILLTVTLPLASKAAFTSKLQLEFREALAQVAGVPVGQVIILSITVARRSGLLEDHSVDRRLLQASGKLSVQTQVTTPSDPVGNSSCDARSLRRDAVRLRVHVLLKPLCLCLDVRRRS
jgi:hypothetical protein